MRDILFRAWDKKRKEMCSVNELSLQEFEIEGFRLDGSLAILYDGEFILEQYAGLLDNNGKKIFEGDIVFFYYERYEIIFHNGRFAMKHKKIHKHKNIPYPVISNVINRFEIIGNIHE